MATHCSRHAPESGIGDLVKTDGDRVVTVTDGHLRIVDASTREIVGSLDLTMYANWQSAQLLTSGDDAIVLLRPSDVYGITPASGPLLAQTLCLNMVKPMPIASPL